MVSNTKQAKLKVGVKNWKHRFFVAYFFKVVKTQMRKLPSVPAAQQMCIQSWNTAPQIQWLLSIICHDNVEHLKLLNREVLFFDLSNLATEDMQHVICRKYH